MSALLCNLMGLPQEHLFLRGLATLWVFSAAVSAMGAPDTKSSQGYQWLYRFAHLLAANLDRSGLFEALPTDRVSETTKE